MKWNTHIVLHTEIDAYLMDQQKKEEGENHPAPISIAQERFLLRKIRNKPNQWWVGKLIRIWREQDRAFVKGTIKSICGKGWFLIQLESGEELTVESLFSSSLPIQLPAMQNTVMFDLYKALPYSIPRSVYRDVKLFLFVVC